MWYMTLSEELKWRGFVNQTTLGSPRELDKRKFTFYFGVDPSASSMTIGNLATAMMALHFARYGHYAYLLIGGATGLIGDPDGKKQERELKSLDEIEANKRGIIKQYNKIFAGVDFKIVDNLDWFKGIGYMQFLREIGKHVPMRQMLGREFVHNRLSEKGAGISYAEFSYVLIQAYDFFYLHKNMGVDLQLCGSDQWGNSIAGVDLIRRLTGSEAHVWSTPLVVNKATGEKFGKSEDGAVWLDSTMTSPYGFYQFWLNVDDDGVEDYLKVYTFLTKEDINNVMHDFKANRSERAAQKRLANEVTAFVHGIDQAERQQKLAEAVFDPDKLHDLDKGEWNILTEELPVIEAHSGAKLVTLLVESRLASSNNEARRFIEDGAVHINNRKIHVSSSDSILSPDDFIEGHAIIRRGKNTQVVVKQA